MKVKIYIFDMWVDISGKLQRIHDLRWISDLRTCDRFIFIKKNSVSTLISLLMKNNQNVNFRVGET